MIILHLHLKNDKTSVFINLAQIQLFAPFPGQETGSMVNIVDFETSINVCENCNEILAQIPEQS